MDLAGQELVGSSGTRTWIYGAQDLDTATFKQQPNWSRKKKNETLLKTDLSCWLCLTKYGDSDTLLEMAKPTISMNQYACDSQ